MERLRDLRGMNAHEAHWELLNNKFKQVASRFNGSVIFNEYQSDYETVVIMIEPKSMIVRESM